jgi:hypothetical protein
MDIMSIVDKARTLESRIARALNRAAADAVGSHEREPLEIAHAIVDASERQIQPGGRGARLFSFNHVAVMVRAPSRQSRVRFEALFASAPSLRDRIIDRVRACGCEVADLRVDIDYAADAGRDWIDPQFHVAFDRIAVEPVALVAVEPETTPTPIELTVVNGIAQRHTYSFALIRIDIGRGAEVRDSRHRLVRCNDLVFVDGSGGINQTVSRRHAHIAVDPVSRAARVYDDRSAQGTGVVRAGRTIPVPPGARGVRLQGGDEIVLGEARVRVCIGESRA